MAIFLDIAQHFPMRWTSFFRRAQSLCDFLLRSPIEARLSWAIKRGNKVRLAELLDISRWPLDKPLAPIRHERRAWGPHEGHTLLHRAVIGGHLGCVKVLVERGASVDAPTRWGITPAMMAAMGADVVILHYLEMQGADLGRRQPSMSTFSDDFVGPTVPEIFKAYAEEDFDAAKAEMIREGMDRALGPAVSHSKGLARERL